MKEKIINYIETLEAKSLQVDDYFKQRNELYIENQNKDKEIERLEKRNKEIYEGFMATQEELKEYAEENERLHSIIEEVRNRTIKMIANSGLDFMYRQAYKDILEILDKENVKAILEQLKKPTEEIKLERKKENK